MTTWHADDLRGALSLGEDCRSWTEALELIEGPFPPPAIPEGDELVALLDQLGVRDEDRADLTAALPALTAPGSPWRWLLDRTVRVLTTGMGTSADELQLGPLLHEYGRTARWFHAAVYLAAMEHTRAYHRSIDLPEDVSRDSLAVFGDQLACYRRSFGEGGCGPFVPLTYVCRGVTFRMGQLDCAVPKGARSIAVGVRGEAGPLTTVPDLRWAKELVAFFHRHVPDFARDVRWGFDAAGVEVISWVNDPALRDYLPEDHDLVRFAGHLGSWLGTEPAGVSQEPDAHGLTEADREALCYAYGRLVDDLETALTLPAHTNVQRAVTTHLRAGKHWRLRKGGYPVFTFWD
ncbi:hypothetical protein FM076_01975 [Streptomyces albus subsp. chlorinus]|uniref:acyltransferase domain-containing protein n=1 Tax=Streptomyces albus TaxID=1888 RepID=UPI00156D8818|nr:acyltransferase domain-containing protein [Streptomyces albus]NSC20039.1 hypothetical protein [Streptomyces albus subsp. chlorinus]